jgi:tRNA A-37 threonylcarbamoyl transferase component Bud32
MVPSHPPAGNDPPPQFAMVANGGLRAQVVPALAEALTALLALPIADWPARGFTVVKSRTVRLVLRGELAGTPCHLKVYRAHTLADRARDRLRGPRGQRGQREFDQMVALRSAGWPVAEPLAVGLLQNAGGSLSFVVTRTVPEAQPFAWPPPQGAAARCGALLRALHDQGLCPADLHPGNLLLDAQAAPWLIDVVGMDRGEPPSLRERARSLAFFCQDLDGGALDPAAAELRHGYGTAGTYSLPDLTAELAAATRTWRSRALVAFGRRSSRDCRHTEVTRARRGQDHWTWHRDDGPDSAQLRSRCVDLAAAPPPPQKHGRRGGVFLDDRVVLKQRSRAAARQLWCAAYWLYFAKVDAPGPLGLCLGRGASYVASRRLPLPTLAEALAGGHVPAAQRAAVARNLGQQVGRLHGHGLRNRDLKFDNLLLDPAACRVWMVDLDGVRRNAHRDWRGAGADLGRLLAAFQAANAPGGAAVLRTFLRAWWRTQRQLLVQPPVRRIVARALVRAGEWASAHSGGAAPARSGP